MENPFGGKIYFKEETQTTMNDALDMVEQGAGEGCLCWSLHQTQGRGRIQGRNWHSAAGESLAFTLILSPELIKVQPSLSLRLGLGLSRYLEEEFKLDIRIKWPNDIYCMGGKLAGILCEYRRGVILAGIGLNLNQKVFP
nr:biotin--[acetyl-CoA-carboxylase] ligase [Spirochaetaceae bacterium]